ncbi:MAG: hypothetical protein KFH98_05700 [Gemmatimonadetes bacterium]|nr:hypothetical protein [Gemmatimonadota bacterium]
MHETMRPLGFGETLDGAFTLLRRNFSAFFGIALLPQIPVILFWFIVPLLLAGAADLDAMQAASLLLMPYSLFATMLVMASLTDAAGVAYGGEEPGIGGSLRRGLRRWLPIAVVSVVTTILMILGFFLLLVPGLIAIAMFFAVYPAVMIEDRGPFDAMGRSRRLSRGARLRILGLLAVALLITYLPVMALGMIAGVSIGITAALNAASFENTNMWLTGLLQAGGIVLGAITTPFLITVVVLMYFDRRARTEAPDLESAVAALQDHAV